MRAADDLLRAYDRTRGRIPANPSPKLRYDRIGPLLRTVGQHRGFLDPAPDLGLAGAELDALIAEQRDFFAARGEAVEWKTRGHDRPAELPNRLIAAGFVAEPQETVMIGVTAQLAGEPVLPPGVTISRVTRRADLERIAALETEVWGEDLSWLADYLQNHVTTAPENVDVLVAEAGGQVVSAAATIDKQSTGFALLLAGSTLKAWRGQGIYRALVAGRAQLAEPRGVRYLQVDASDHSRAILLRLGFRIVTTTTPYVYQPPADR